MEARLQTPSGPCTNAGWGFAAIDATTSGQVGAERPFGRFIRRFITAKAPRTHPAFELTHTHSYITHRRESDSAGDAFGQLADVCIWRAGSAHVTHDRKRRPLARTCSLELTIFQTCAPRLAPTRALSRWLVSSPTLHTRSGTPGLGAAVPDVPRVCVPPCVRRAPWARSPERPFGRFIRRFITAKAPRTHPAFELTHTHSYITHRRESDSAGDAFGQLADVCIWRTGSAHVTHDRKRRPTEAPYGGAL